MNHSLKFYIIYAILYGIILLTGEGMYRLLKLKPEWSRNFSHLAAGLVSLPYPWIFSSHWWVLGLAIQSSAFLYLTRYMGWIPSHHQPVGRSLGSFLFFISLYLCYFASDQLHKPHFFVFPILVLSIGDVAASIAGRYYGKSPEGFLKHFFAKGKTLAGSMAFFFSAFGVVIVAYYSYMQTGIGYALVMALLISLASAMAEALSSNGYDNFFVPSIILFIMYLEGFI